MWATERKNHWEKIYSTKLLKEVSWFQPVPEISLQLIQETNPSAKSKIIDVGGGDSLLVDHLLELGFSDITVLDISEKAILRAKERLGEKEKKINWVVHDVVSFQSAEKYDVWHDRATFHFLTREEEISSYLKLLDLYLKPNGILIVGTFSEKGPKKCSGIDIKSYSQEEMINTFSEKFQKIKCLNTDHLTPSQATQNFTFCMFRKIGNGDEFGSTISSS